MPAKRVILDVDTGTDDAVAIIMAALSPAIELVAVTTVWGNLPIGNTTDNTLRVLDFIGKAEVPVYRGLGKPFAPHPYRGLGADRGNAGLMHPAALDLPATSLQERSQPAVEWLVETLRAATEQITLVAVGPLTNIAAALTLDPTITEKVDELVIMGGANEFGNVTPAAEGNVWCDPIAADVVFQGGFSRIVLVPLDATHRAVISADQAKELKAVGTPGAVAAAVMIEQRVLAHDKTQPQPIAHTAAVHDPLCIAYLIDPAVVDLEPLHVAIDTTSLLNVGRTVIDVRKRGFEEPNAYVALSANAGRFFEVMKEAVATQQSPGAPTK